MRFKKFLYFKIIILVTVASCNTSKGPFHKRSPHEKYGDNITAAGLKQTQLGRMWFAAADKSLRQPNEVTLPFKETGYFPAERPSAVGYAFPVRMGENILVTITTIPATGIAYFAELWQSTGDETSLLTTIDTLDHQIKYPVKKDDRYLLRIQPELLRSAEYTVTITTSPSLAFPVDSSGNPQFISFWGAGRDAGARTHEGIDIKANFRTPVLSGTNGVARVMENNLGGKVVFVYDASTGNSLYYAHLDSQVVHTGENVARGEVVGLVGNTGNAINTVPHLHFGIYTRDGPVNPLVFIDPEVSKPKPVTVSVKQLNKWMRISASTDLYDGPSAKSSIKIKVENGNPALVLGASHDRYRIQLPGGDEGYINHKLMTDKKLRSQTIKDSIRLLDSANLDAPSKIMILKGNTVDIIGSYKDFYLIDDEGLVGWIMKN